MYYLNDPLVKSKYERRQAQVLSDSEHRDLARYSLKSSQKLTNRSVDRLGDGLIRLGNRLKDGEGTSSSTMQLTFDCD
jgi:hypothetical protein